MVCALCRLSDNCPTLHVPIPLASALRMYGSPRVRGHGPSAPRIRRARRSPGLPGEQKGRERASGRHGHATSQPIASVRPVHMRPGADLKFRMLRLALWLTSFFRVVTVHPRWSSITGVRIMDDVCAAACEVRPIGNIASPIQDPKALVSRLAVSEKSYTRFQTRLGIHVAHNRGLLLFCSVKGTVVCHHWYNMNSAQATRREQRLL